MELFKINNPHHACRDLGFWIGDNVVDQVIGYDRVRALKAEVDPILALEEMRRPAVAAEISRLRAESSPGHAVCHYTRSDAVWCQLEWIFKVGRVRTTLEKVCVLIRKIKKDPTSTAEMLKDLTRKVLEKPEDYFTGADLAYVKKDLEHVRDALAYWSKMKAALPSVRPENFPVKWDDICNNLRYDAYYMYSDDPHQYRAGKAAEEAAVKYMRTLLVSGDFELVKFLRRNFAGLVKLAS